MTVRNSFICGIVLLVFLNMVAILAFASPYWIVEYESSGSSRNTHGLFLECGSHKLCATNDDLHLGLAGEFTGWFIAVQGLMSVGLALCLISLLIATISLCCQKHNCSSSGVIAGLLLTAFLAMCVAVILFGIKTSQNHNVQVAFGSTDGNSFGWSFWLGAAAAALSLATSGVYGCASRID